MAASSEKSKAYLPHSVECKLEVPFLSTLTQVQASLTILKKGEREQVAGELLVINEAGTTSGVIWEAL